MPIMVKNLISQPITPAMNSSLTSIPTLLDLFQTNFSKFKSSFHRTVSRLVSQSTITIARAVFFLNTPHVGLMLYYAYLSNHLGSFVNEIILGSIILSLILTECYIVVALCQKVLILINIRVPWYRIEVNKQVSQRITTVINLILTGCPTHGIIQDNQFLLS